MLQLSTHLVLSVVVALGLILTGCSSTPPSQPVTVEGNVQIIQRAPGASLPGNSETLVLNYAPTKNIFVQQSPWQAPTQTTNDNLRRHVHEHRGDRGHHGDNHVRMEVYDGNFGRRGPSDGGYYRPRDQQVSNTTAPQAPQHLNFNERVAVRQAWDRPREERREILNQLNPQQQQEARQAWRQERQAARADASVPQHMNFNERVAVQQARQQQQQQQQGGFQRVNNTQPTRNVHPQPQQGVSRPTAPTRATVSPANNPRAQQVKG